MLDTVIVRYIKVMETLKITSNSPKNRLNSPKEKGRER
jgi:hypothetical protein